MENLTPMMKQYFDIKNRNPDKILFFRLGDFYEMFYDDAKVASEILGIALTGKAAGDNKKAPMCGVPYHSSRGYIQKLINAGKKVAICEQMEDPKEAKGIVKREIIRVVTPGTVLDDELIDRDSNNYIMSIITNENHPEMPDVSYVDISTGEVNCIKIEIDRLSDLIFEVSPKEILTNQEFYESLESNSFKSAKTVKSIISQNDILINTIITDDLPEFAQEQSISEAEPVSLLAVYKYIFDTQKTLNLSFFHKKQAKKSMKLDHYCLKNLEIIEPISKNSRYSLFWAVNYTKTAMGARKLKSFLLRPSNDADEIKNRLDIVELLIKDYRLTGDISEELKKIYDFERISNKIAYNTVSHKDLIDLKNSLACLSNIYSKVKRSDYERIKRIFSDEDMRLSAETENLIDSAIVDFDFKEGKSKYIIKSSYDIDLEKYRKLIDDTADVLIELEQSEKERTGLKTLKIGYNKVFGYYIEITKSALAGVSVPSDYIRKQTLVSSERFVSENLGKIEQEILSSKTKQDELESELYKQVKEQLKSYLPSILVAARQVAELDVYVGFAKNAVENEYVRPVISDGEDIIIKNARHPVIEKILPDKAYIPNDTELLKSQTHIITGPNMAGKSTYMRQVATIAILAHIGSFVPCSFASIPMIDNIFTRIGANDDLAMGKSTFMVEMLEVANILKNSTKNSLIILDEIGRGTSTYDGMSLAFAIVEYIAKKTKSKTLVSTHYHELTDLEGKYKNIINYKMLVDDSDEVRFLRKIIKGKADKSYGIHVASLSGIPYEVLERAKVILDKLESQNDNGARVFAGSSEKSTAEPVKDTQEQISIREFKNETNLKIVEEIKKMKLDTLTPKQALDLLYKLQEELK